MAVFPGKPPNPLGLRVEISLAGVWTDITKYVMQRNMLHITNMGRVDEASGIQAGQLTLTLKNDGRFTPKNTAGAYYPNIIRNTPVRVSVSASSTAPLNVNPGFEVNAANWTGGSGATIARSTAQAHTGVASLSLHGDGVTASPQAASELEPVTAGASYTAAAWFFNASAWASGCGADINWYTSGSVFISSSFNFIGSLPAGSWTQAAVTATAPGTAAFASVVPIVAGTPAAGNIFFVDDAALYPAANFYAGSRFYGQITSWPPTSDISQHDVYVNVTANGIWQQIAQSQVPIGSAYTRYVRQLTGTSVPATSWTMEDGNGAVSFATGIGAGAAAAFTGTPSFAQDGTSFAGTDALPQFNAARITANVSSGATATDAVVRFALAVPAAGDSITNGFPGGGEVANVLMPSGTGVKRMSVSLVGNQLVIQGWAATTGGSALWTGVISTKVNGVPVLVSAELTPSGGSINWALRIIKPGAGAVLDQVTGTQAASTIAAVTQVTLNIQGRLGDTTFGQLGVFYAVPSLVTAAAALGGFAGETAVARFQRLCAEFSITSEVIGSASAAMGPQVDDTLANQFQMIEATDGGLLFEAMDQFALGYRTLASMQNQSVAVTLNYAAGTLGAPLAATYDNQLTKNQWAVANFDGYTALATLNTGALSIQPVPNGVGPYSGQVTINANTHAQVNAIAQQRLFQGTVDDIRYPQVTTDLRRTQVASLFAAVPALRVGDYLQITSLPAFQGASTAKQLVWGWDETLNAFTWSQVFNTVPELPFETSFTPGTFSVVQAPAGTVAAGSQVGSSVAGSQISPGVAGSIPTATLTARSAGGSTSFIAAATPYDWTFAVSGTPADVTYFIGTQDQAAGIAAGDTFINTGGFGGPFTVTSVDPPSGGNVTVHFTPDASSVMSSGTVQGGKNGDTWVNTSAGNQLNQWAAGGWTPVTWNAHNVITAGTITATEIQANTITAGQLAAGIVYVGIVDATTINSATINAATINTSTINGTNYVLDAQGVKIYDASTTVLRAQVSGQSAADPFGNQMAPGYVGSVKNWVPSSPGTIDAWNNPTPPAGWSGRNRYKNMAENNCVLIDVQLTGSVLNPGNITCFTLPAAYHPANGMSEPMFVTTSAGTAWPTTLRMSVSTAGVVSTSALTGTVTNFGCTFIMALD